MKLTFWMKLFLAVPLALILTNCSSPTPDVETGPGTIIDEDTPAPTDENVKSTDEKMGPPENSRPTIKNGVEYGKWEAIHFDYDSATIRSADRSTLEDIAKWSKDNPGSKMIVEGHCDERGTPEYNRVLGQRRAVATRAYLIKLGVGSKNISTVSFGEDKPADTSHNDEAWGKNRRAEFGVIK